MEDTKRASTHQRGWISIQPHGRVPVIRPCDLFMESVEEYRASIKQVAAQGAAGYFNVEH